jgi:hypothetical protein
MKTVKKLFKQKILLSLTRRIMKARINQREIAGSEPRRKRRDRETERARARNQQGRKQHQKI